MRKLILCTTLLFLPVLGGCPLFDKKTEGEAFAQVLTGIETEYMGLSTTVEDVVKRSITDEAKRLAFLDKILEGRSNVENLLKDGRALLKESLGFDPEETKAKILELTQELLRLKTLVSQGT